MVSMIFDDQSVGAGTELTADHMRHLPAYFADIPDPRRRQGQRHSLATILALAAGAILCGMEGYKAITGQLVKHECVEALNLSVTKAAGILGVTRQALSNFINGKSGISPEMAACERALAIHSPNYRSITSILKKVLDQRPLDHPQESEDLENTLPEHRNVRGSGYYH